LKNCSEPFEDRYHIHAAIDAAFAVMFMLAPRIECSNGRMSRLDS